MTLPRRRRDWALGLAPQELAGSHEGLLFAAICLLALWLVTVADLVGPRHATVGAIALLPVAAASWLLSRRLILLVVAIAMLLGGAEAVAGVVSPTTALSQIAMMPLLAILTRLAATNVLRRRDEERNAQQARALERAKSDFLRLASHELRGPVAILRGYLSMLEDGSLGALTPGIERVVPVLIATATGMNRTVDQMLDVARLEDSRLQLNFARADLAACVREAASTVRVLHADSHPVVVRADTPVHLDFDQIRIATVVGNLVSNAVKYSPAGSRIAVNLEAGEHEATVAVADRGIGIKPDDLPRLFTRFGRINDPRSRGVPGTGLGLYLSRELARLHGGDITVVSEPGQGSTFTLRLPVTRTPGSPSSAPELRPSAASRPQQVAS
jgi:signal transduction histidine kinase